MSFLPKLSLLGQEARSAAEKQHPDGSQVDLGVFLSHLTFTRPSWFPLYAGIRLTLSFS